jgi:hypothetical protein
MIDPDLLRELKLLSQLFKKFQITFYLNSHGFHYFHLVVLSTTALYTLHSRTNLCRWILQVKMHDSSQLQAKLVALTQAQKY